MAIDTNIFLEKLILEGYTHFCVVPCSFAKNLINCVINNVNIEYVPSASESIACSIAAGLKIAGKKPIVIVQSSGLTNMGSCITSLLKPYDITFPILVSWRTYTEGDSEIQHQHLSSKLPILVNAYGYEYDILDQNNIDNSVYQINKCNKSNIICFIKKDTFTKVELEKKHQLNLSSYILRSEYLKNLNEKFKNDDLLFIGTTGNTAREMYSFMPDVNKFYMVGNMGGLLSLGLGVSLSGRKVILCGGDAEFVMHMGGLTTAGRYKDIVNITYILFDNESNKSTGGQNTYQKHINYIEIARNSNFDVIEEVIYTLDDFSRIINMVKNKNGLNFICVKCDLDPETPRPPLKVIKINEL